MFVLFHSRRCQLNIYSYVVSMAYDWNMSVVTRDIQVTRIFQLSRNNGGMELTGENGRTSRKTSRSAALTTLNTDFRGSNP
jgi:hypothetical protein